MYLHNKKISVVVSDFDGTIIKPGMLTPKERFFEKRFIGVLGLKLVL